MKITTLTIDSDDGVATTVHSDSTGAWEELHRVLVETDGEDVVPPAEDPDALLEYATTEGGLALWIDEHEVHESYAANEPVMVVVDRENPSGRVLNLSCAECGSNAILLVDVATRHNGLEAAGGVIVVNEDTDHNGFETSHFECGRCRLKMQLDPEVEELISW